MKLTHALAAFLVLFAPLAQAATLTATPASFAAVRDAAKAGDTIVLGAGDYRVAISNRTYAPALKIDARAAGVVFTGLNVDKVSGLEITGGTFNNGCTVTPCYSAAWMVTNSTGIKALFGTYVGPEVSTPGQLGVAADGYGVRVIGSKTVEIVGNSFTGFKSAVTLGFVDGFLIDRNRLTRARSDGMVLGQVWRGRITRNDCDGTKMLSAEHPDCIQLFSRPDTAPTSDIYIGFNRMLVDSQGIFLGNHTRLYPIGQKIWRPDGSTTTLTEATSLSDGGFDRIVVEGNVVGSSFPNGIALYDARASEARANLVFPLANSLYPSRLNIFGGSVASCGNTVEPPPRGDYKGLTETPCAGAPTPAQSTEIADLKVQLAAAEAKAARLAADLAALQASAAGDAEAARQAATALQAALQAAQAEAAALRDRLAQIAALAAS